MNKGGEKSHWGGATLRADRLTACPSAPGRSDSLFNTSAESEVMPGTSAAGWQPAYPVSVGPPLPLASQQRGRGTNDRAVKTEWQGEEERQSQTGRVRGRHWGRNVLGLSARAKRPGEGAHYWHFSPRDGLANTHRVQVAGRFLGDLWFHSEKRPLSSRWRCEQCGFGLGIRQTDVQDGVIFPNVHSNIRVFRSSLLDIYLYLLQLQQQGRKELRSRHFY